MLKKIKYQRQFQRSSGQAARSTSSTQPGTVRTKTSCRSSSFGRAPAPRPHPRCRTAIQIVVK